MPTTSRPGAERFAADAIDALALRCGIPPASSSNSSNLDQLRHMPLAIVARQCLELSGEAPTGYMSDEDIATIALQAGSAAGGSYNRPADFPNLLAGLANKILDQAVEISQVTYPLWTARVADLPDFKPSTVVGIGGPAELDEVIDDRPIDPVQLTEELAGWIQIGRYANSVSLTPVMVANDDLDAFAQAVQSLAMAHEHTLNRLCIALVGGNAPMADGFQLFNAAVHGNDIVAPAGGPPSTVQANAMRLLHRRQLGIGGEGRVSTPPKIALVPTAWEEAAMQTFLQFSRLNESKIAITDATVNTFRGSIEPVVEPDLDDYSLTAWYTFSDPRIRRTIVHAFQRGYGRGGKRSRWFDTSRKSLIFDLEGRFAAAAISWRGAVRNAGA